MTNRCAEPGCGRFTRRGQDFCGRHDGEIADGPGAVDANLFRLRLAQGEFQSLLDAPLRDAIAQAGGQRGLTSEIGALRVVLARLLLEEDDLDRLVSGVTRLSGAVVQAARAERQIAGDQRDWFVTAIDNILTEIQAAGPGEEEP